MGNVDAPSSLKGTNVSFTLCVKFDTPLYKHLIPRTKRYIPFHEVVRFSLTTNAKLRSLDFSLVYDNAIILRSNLKKIIRYAFVQNRSFRRTCFAIRKSTSRYFIAVRLEIYGCFNNDFYS